MARSLPALVATVLRCRRFEFDRSSGPSRPGAETIAFEIVILHYSCPLLFLFLGIRDSPFVSRSLHFPASSPRLRAPFPAIFFPAPRSRWKPPPRGGGTPWLTRKNSSSSTRFVSTTTSTNGRLRADHRQLSTILFALCHTFHAFFYSHAVSRPLQSLASPARPFKALAASRN